MADPDSTGDDRDDERSPEHEFREMLDAFLAGQTDIDPAALAGAAGLPADPAVLQQIFSRLRDAMAHEGDGIDWSLAEQQAGTIAGQKSVVSLPEERAALEQALSIAELWVDEATDLPRSALEPRLMSRQEWAAATLPVWSQIAEPVAVSIGDALSGALAAAAGDGIADVVPQATSMMRKVAGALFSMQLGQVVGQLSGEVVSGGDIGIPLLSDGQPAMVSQNAMAFGQGLDVPTDQVEIWLAVRELAHARLFRHSRWQRLQFITGVTDYARGIEIDTDALERVAAELDPSDPSSLREALQSGALIPPRTEAQRAALERLETSLALVEGWVDVVTADATSRLPSANALAETVRRRRASGGPAEQALAALVGLELRPRRLREAAAMWRAVTDAVGTERRDALWSHPDLVPTATEIDDPAALIARLTGPAPEPDDLDREIQDLLGG